MLWRRKAVRGVNTEYTASVVPQRAGSAPGTLISVYTGAIARFLVGNSPFNACTSFEGTGKSERLQAAGWSRLAPPAPLQALELHAATVDGLRLTPTG